MYQVYDTDLKTVIVRVSDKACIPCDPANTDYVAYLEWVAEGNTPEPWQPEGGV